MPFYEVQLVAYATVVVEAVDDGEAGLVALEETPMSAYQAEGGEVKGEIPRDELEMQKANADHYLPM